jgi:transposase InsO family protein
MCRVIKVSKSGFYAWLKRQDAPPTPIEEARQQRRSLVEIVFQESDNIYGYRKVHAELQRRGMTYALNTIYADFQALDIKSVTRKKYRVKTTDSNHNNSIAENVLCRDFKAEKPNQRWVTDITYVATFEGFLYFVAIIDLFSRKVIGYAMADHLKSELVVSALQMVIGRGRKIAEGIYLHRDRGVQFTAEDFRKVLKLVGIEQSMSRKGDCWDNAPCESWFGKLKTEWIYPNGVYKTRAEAELSIVEYIEMFYNSKRLHQSLGYRTPNEVEREYSHRERGLRCQCVKVE